MGFKTLLGSIPGGSMLKPQVHMLELGVFFYILGFYRWMPWFKKVVFWGISGISGSLFSLPTHD